MDLISGSDFNLQVVFQTKEGSVVPDTGSVKLSLRDHTGSLVITDQAVSVGTGDNAVSITIAGSNNTLVSNQKFARRSVIINYALNGTGITQRYDYRVVPWLNHSASPEKVRSLLGVNAGELPDADIDLIEAYYDIESLLSDFDVVLNDKLIASNLDEFNANDLIICQAALDVIPSLKLRIAQKEDNGALSFARFAAAPDYDQIAADIEGRMEEALEALTGVAVTTPTLLAFADRTDPVTNA